MLSRIFPTQIDTGYRGYRLAIWLLLLLLLGRAFASFNAVGLNPDWPAREVLRGVYAIPLDAFAPAAVDAAQWLYARWGVTHSMLTLMGFIAVLRYRATIPLIYLLVTLDHLGMKLFAGDTPAGPSSALLPLIGVALPLIGFGMSITTPRARDGKS